MNPVDVATLLSLRENETAQIIEIQGGALLETKLKAMGLYKGRNIVKRSPADSNGPSIVEVMGTSLALGQGMASQIIVKIKPRKLMLAGNPNVGKSVVFARLTGLEVISSNYPGTTVEYTSGHTVLAGERFTIIDVPGAYSHQATNKAEEVASGLLAGEDKSLILNVVDATNLERNLFYTLELSSLGVPIIILLNKWDIANTHGVNIDTAILQKHLGIRVIPFVATTGEGIAELKAAMDDFKKGLLSLPAQPPENADDRWKLIGRITAECQKITHRHATFLEKMQDATSRPATGLPIAALVMFAVFLIIRNVGEGLINYLLDPLFTGAWMPFLKTSLGGLGDGFLKTMLLGATPEPMQSFGLLTTGLYLPFVTVLPYIVSFYFVLSLLEDVGYLPRLAVLLDSYLHHIGLHGYGTVPLMLGLGCKVPAILATRVLETPRERVIATALTLTLAPCMPQTAMIFSLLSPYPLKYTFVVFLSIAFVGIVSSYILSRMLKGETPELFIEIPPYQIPTASILGRKLYLRLKDFIIDAVPMIILGVLIVGLLETAGLLNGLAQFFKPVVTGMLGLPPETVSVLTLGFLRKDVSIALLVPFNLAPGAIVVASVLLTLYMPCMASFMVSIRELGIKKSALVFCINLTAAVIFSILLNLFFRLINW
ncbi:MAG: fused ferrous iron transport protein A/B [Syntrophobacterales bacterium]|nr:fused ferrous iron transport protein A/B [Syntrophobacterales bacterium]